MSILQRIFSAGEVSKGLGVPMSTLQPWLNRGVIVGHRVAGGGSQGKHRQFTFNNLMEIAIAYSLTSIGQASVSDAFKAASLFAFAGGPVATAQFVEREVGVPFHPKLGRTMLAISGDRSVELLWKDGEDLMLLARHHLNRPVVLAIVDVGEIFARVVTAFGEDPHAVLEEAYAPRSEGEVQP